MLLSIIHPLPLLIFNFIRDAGLIAADLLLRCFDEVFTYLALYQFY